MIRLAEKWSWERDRERRSLDFNYGLLIYWSCQYKGYNPHQLHEVLIILSVFVDFTWLFARDRERMKGGVKE